MEFDFNNQAPGTELLSVGLSMGWTYNMASIFFNFDTAGSVTGEKTYYFDDVRFGELVQGLDKNLKEEGSNVFPNPTSNQWTISSENTEITKVEIFDVQDKLILTLRPNSRVVNIDASTWANTIYISKISTQSETSIFKLTRK